MTLERDEAAKPGCCGALGSAGVRGEARPRPERVARELPERFVRLKGGAFRMGSDDGLLPLDGEGPSRVVRVNPFAIDPFAVTNAWFADFVDATGHVTEAERFGWSYVFFSAVAADLPDEGRVPEAPWWRKVSGASWRRPEGPGSAIGDRLDHPVVHVSWHDAQAFAAWAGCRLPSEAEWEYAARGGLEGRRFPWGDAEPAEDGAARCNIWQGSFPDRNTGADGYLATAPVDAYAPNGYGLHNMVGNTWEWCADRFRVRSLKRAVRERNARELQENRRVVKGGSYLCHRSYCYRYRVAARSSNTPDTSTGHVGFRVVAD
ncbi:MAG TPA: formylglycine-generating enzyme family protein [Beijerinckiaceae bacterium]|nr:formylglycine-generating enzyme family protein [Beijerinckiaceae bacterium]